MSFVLFPDNPTFNLQTVLRVRLIGIAKVVSVESPLWFINTSTIPIHLTLREEDKKNTIIFSHVVPSMPNGYPLPVDLPAKFIEKRVSWYISVSQISAVQQYHPIKLPLSFSKDQSKSIAQDTELTIPVSSTQNVSLSVSSISTHINPEQRLIALRTPYAFR